MTSTSTYGQRIVDRIFELDAKYRGGKIKSRNRQDFVKEHLYAMVDRALELEFNRGMRTRNVG